MREVARLVVLAFVLSGVGCAAKVHVDNPDPFAEDDPRAYTGKRAKKSPTAATANTPEIAAATRVQSGTIDRASLNDVLERGIGAFLSGVEVQAYFDNHQFAGWEVLRFWPRHARLSRVDLRPGDVVVAVNRHRLERPEQVQRLWKELRTADTLIVSGHRLGTPFELRFEIRGSHR